MKKVSLSDCKPYSAPKHYDMKALRLQGKDETGIQKFWVACPTSCLLVVSNMAVRKSPAIKST
jgi:hypothetical protein